MRPPALRPQRRHPLFARLYPRISDALEPHGPAYHRRELLAGLEGRVVEVGAGHGQNFRYYPRAVSEVLAVEPEPHLRVLARAAAAQAPVPVRVVAADAGRLPVRDGAFDAGVVSLVLCSVPSQASALAELHRVLRVGGQLRFYEHLRATTPGLRRLQRAADVVWPLLAGGCHTGRDTLAAISAAGFDVVGCRRFDFPPSRVRLPASPHVLGRALCRVG